MKQGVKLTDAFYTKTECTYQAAVLLSDLAYRFGYRVAMPKKHDEQYQFIDDADWNSIAESKSDTLVYLTKRLDALKPTRARPTKRTIIPFYDLRKDTVTICFECYVKEENGKTWYVCDPTEVITNMEGLAACG